MKKRQECQQIFFMEFLIRLKHTLIIEKYIINNDVIFQEKYGIIFDYF